MPRKKVVKKSEKEEMRDKLKGLFPDAVDLMAKALKDDLKDKTGRKVKVTVGQKLAIAHSVVDQVLGRPPQGTALGTDKEKIPITTLEVVKYVENPVLDDPMDDVPSELETEPVSVALTPRDSWLQDMENEAVGVTE